MQPDLDLLILGGGCAGLSLGDRLAEQPATAGRTMIVEARPAYANDRTWCFWRVEPHRYEGLVARSWAAMSIRSADREVAVTCPRTPYQMLESAAFYDAVQARIAASAAVRLQLGTRVLGAPRRCEAGWAVETNAGRLTSRHLIDTRPPAAPRPGDAVLWQSFLGQEVRCEAPVFDPASVQLMHFATAPKGAVLFRYVLPFSRHEALVETTVFGPRPMVAAEFAALQQAAVAEMCGSAAVQIRRVESGILPMGLTRLEPRKGSDHCRAGVMSGGARPSSGYAFQRIQSWATAAAARIAGGGAPRGHRPDPLVQRTMDRLFLQVVRRHPERAPEMFTRLFGDTDPARTIRFLSDRGSIADCAAVGFTLPLGLFAGEVLRGLRRVPEPTTAPA